MNEMFLKSLVEAEKLSHGHNAGLLSSFAIDKVFIVYGHDEDTMMRAFRHYNLRTTLREEDRGKYK